LTGYSRFQPKKKSLQLLAGKKSAIRLREGHSFRCGGISSAELTSEWREWHGELLDKRRNPFHELAPERKKARTVFALSRINLAFVNCVS
jgi:hypothetical protein